jgi:amino acid adenylation domain-containing protein
VTPQTGLDPADPSQQAAYIMFTSGSTGEPKGVVITHENVRRFVEWAVPYFEISRADRHSGHPPLHFDLSVFDLFGTFAAGAELHLIPSELNLVPDKLLEFLRVSAITQWFSVPTTLTYLAKHGLMSEPDLPSLKRVLSCGEVLPAGTLNHWMRRVPHARFTNLYGPTETTIASSYFSVPASVEQTGSVPIGTPCDGEQLLILDDHLEPLPPGAVGEICIGGVGVSPGYWQDDERTRTAFVRDPFSSRPGDRLYRTGDLGTVDPDGVFHFVGRCDLQIKSRGYRIELGEIETALGGIAGLVAGAVVGLTTEGFEGMTICCAYSAALGVTTDPTKIRRELSRLLPRYMLPSRWKALPRLPTNSNGKIDRAAIKELFEREHDRSSR